jgi:hypothetical protein
MSPSDEIIVPEATMHDPRVPETLEGWSVLHQMFRVRWDAGKALPEADRRGRAEAAAAILSGPEGEQAIGRRPSCRSAPWGSTLSAQVE